MENWEREYLQTVWDDKARKAAARTRPSPEHEGHYEACWEEIERPDGSKFYALKPEVVEKQKKKQAAKEKREAVLHGVKKAVKTLAAIGFAAVVFGAVLSNWAGRETYDSELLDGQNPNALEALADAELSEADRAERSLLDGVGFFKMAKFLGELRACSNELLDDAYASDLSFSEIEARLWNDKLTALESELAALQYHANYEELVLAHREILEMEKELLPKLQGDGQNEKVSAYNQACEKHRSLFDVLVNALDQNGIPYQEDEDGGITFEYKLY